MTRSLSAAIAQAKGEEVLLDPRHDAPRQPRVLAHSYASEVAPRPQRQAAEPESVWSLLAQIGCALVLTLAGIVAFVAAVTA